MNLSSVRLNFREAKIMTNVTDSVDNDRKAKLAASAIARAAYLKQERLAQQARPAPITMTQAGSPAPRLIAFLMAIGKR